MEERIQQPACARKLLALVASGLLLAACGGEQDDAGAPKAGSTAGSAAATNTRGVSATEIVIGSATDFSGATAIWGVGSINAARLRFNAMNAAGGIHGRQIRFVTEDHGYQVPRAIQGANKLVNRDNVFALFMNVGTPINNAIMPMQFEQNVPNLFPISGARSMVEPFHPLKFTQRGIYYDEVRAATRYFLEEQGKQIPCVIYQDTEYGQEILEAVQDQTAAMGTSIAARSSHKPTESEFTSAILRLRQANCDLVLMGTIFRDTILILDAARKMDWQGVAWVGNNAAYSQVIADAPSGEGYYAFVHMARLYAEDEKSPAVQGWWDRYVAEYDAEPGLSAMEGHRAADLTVRALEAAGPELTLEGFLQALEGIVDYTDIFGYRVSFAADKHSGATESVLSQVQEGKWVELDQSISY